MKNVLFIALKDLSYMLREKPVLIWMFLMPVVFFGFIGTTTQGFGGAGGTQKVAVWLHGDGNDPVNRQILHRLAEEDFEVRTFSAQQPIDDAGNAFERYSRRVWLPADSSVRMQGGEDVEIPYAVKSDDLNGDYQSFRISKAVYQTLADWVVARKINPDDLSGALLAVNAQPRQITLLVSEAGQKKPIPDGFDQAVPGILVMFILMIAVSSGAEALFTERQTGVLRRLAASPVSRRQLVAGKWLGKWLLTLMQLAYGMVLGALLFRIHWGPNWPGVVLILTAWSAGCAAFAVLLGSVAKNQGQVSSIGVYVSLLLAALGGCWWPIEVAPTWMQSLANFLPTGWVMDALHRLMYFGASFSEVWPHQLALYLLAALSVALAFSKFNHEVK